MNRWYGEFDDEDLDEFLREIHRTSDAAWVVLVALLVGAVALLAVFFR